MERKNKLILFLLIVLVMGGAMLLGFGLTLFGTTEAEIVLLGETDQESIPPACLLTVPGPACGWTMTFSLWGSSERLSIVTQKRVRVLCTAGMEAVVK